MGKKRSKNVPIQSTTKSAEQCWSNLLEMLKKCKVRHDLAMPVDIKKSITDLLINLKSNLELKNIDKRDVYEKLHHLYYEQLEDLEKIMNYCKFLETNDTKPVLVFNTDHLKELEDHLQKCQKMEIMQNLNYMQFMAKFLNSSFQLTNNIKILQNNLDHLKTILKNEDYSLKTRNLWDACKYGPLAAVQYWLHRFPELINQYENQNSSYAPIHLAVKHGKKDIVSYLLANGANINYETNTYKKSVIHIACEIGDLDMLKFLVQNNANPFLSDAINRNAGHYAVMSKSEKILEYLFELCVYFLQEDINKISPLHLAKILNYGQIINIIEKFVKIQKEVVVNLSKQANEYSATMKKLKDNEGVPKNN